MTIESGTATSRQASTTRVSLSVNIRSLPRMIARDGMLNPPGEVPNNNLKPDEPTGISRQWSSCKRDASGFRPEMGLRGDGKRRSFSRGISPRDSQVVWHASVARLLQPRFQARRGA